ncbi:MAG: hypothetical protein AAB778_00080 [Patescibacteria group bacterium]
MDIKPIEILIEDSPLLTQLASFLDRDDLLTDIQNIRQEKLKMSNLFNRNLVEELYKYHYGLSLGLIKKDGYLQYIKGLSEKYKNVSEIPLSFNMPITIAMSETNKLLHKYNKNLGYLMAVIYAILCGKVKNGDYTSNTHTLFLTPEIIKGVLFEPPFSYVTLVISPESTPDEVQEAFKKAYSTYFYDKRRPFKLVRSDKLRSIAHDTMSNISNIRKWYWMNHKFNPERAGYRKIENTTGFPLQTIRSGISAYKKLLCQYI